jgi:exonuclease SbcC
MDDQARDECFAAVDEKRERHEHRAELVGSLRSAEQHHERAVGELERVEERHSEVALNDDFYDHLENVRTLLHRDNLPRIVSQNYLELLETDTNELLTLFDTDFQIRAIEGMGFETLFEDGRVQPAARLSGGQKVVLSLAFRIAVNAMFANDLSLLCLDEPTAYLDDDNLGCLAIALDRLRDLSASRGLQCVLITHEHSLGPLFDNVVQL